MSKTNTKSERISSHTEGLLSLQKEFAAMAEGCKSRILGRLSRYLKYDMELARDLYQDAIERAINSIVKGQYIEKGNFEAWLLRICLNLANDFLRRKKRQNTINVQPLSQPADGEFSFYYVMDTCKNREGEIISKETADYIRFLIEKLPPEQKEVVEMRFDQKLTFQKISEIQNVSINTALGRMRYALINMRKEILEEKKKGIYFL